MASAQTVRSGVFVYSRSVSRRSLCMGTRKSVPVIVNSDEARPDLRPSWLDLGATECLSRPLDIGRSAFLVESLVQRPRCPTSKHGHQSSVKIDGVTSAMWIRLKRTTRKTKSQGNAMNTLAAEQCPLRLIRNPPRRPCLLLPPWRRLIPTYPRL